MREILFRGKAINRDKGFRRTSYKNGEWVYGLISRLYDERFKNLPAEMINTDGIGGIEVDYKTISQFTGLTDKNGKKIFEGDILNCLTSDFDGSDKYVYNYKITDITDFEKMGFLDFCNELEVIGNIHDNPELLKGGAEE